MDFEKIQSAWLSVMHDTTIVYGCKCGEHIRYKFFSASEFSTMCGKNRMSKPIKGYTDLVWGRSKPNSKAQKAVADGEILCPTAELEAMVKPGVNGGNAFEQLIIEKLGGEATPPMTPHWDFSLNNKKYECKFESCTVANAEYLFNQGLITFDEATQKRGK